MKTVVVIKKRAADYMATSEASGHWDRGTTPEKALAELRKTDRSLGAVELILK